MKKLIFITMLLNCLWILNVNVYAADSNYISSYEIIQWGTRGNDTFYCLDICDENWKVYAGLQAIECGEGLHSWSPKQFLNELGISDEDVVGLKFNWRVWSPGGYGGEGFEGQVVINAPPACQGMPYASTHEKIQWECRGSDTFYCIDIFDKNWNMLHQAADCNDGLHSFDPQTLHLESGTYNWTIWSANGYGGEGFEGQFENISDAVVENSCDYRLNSDVILLNELGGIVKVNVYASTGCSWEARAKDSWLSIRSGGTGSGNGTFELLVLPANDSRTGTVTIADKTLTVKQVVPVTPSVCEIKCTLSGFSYSCATSSHKAEEKYCYMGNTGFVNYLKVTYTNGHTITCSSSSCGGPLFCKDDTGESCTIY